jgi:SAM-dependent methyltransferase
MLRNAVNRHDLTALRSRAVAGRITRRLGGAGRRTRAAWDGVEHRDVAPWAVPAVRAHRRRKISGDPAVDVAEHIAWTVLDGRSDLLAVSLGCGYGAKERRWATTGRFARIDAFDLSPERIEHARGAAAEAGVGEILSFVVADAFTFAPAPGGYDVVIVDSSLHHFRRLDELVPRLAGWLGPEGLVVMHEYVGPRRFQWTARQVELADDLLHTLPMRLRMRADGRLKERVVRPSRLRMWFEDPSEAVESDRIMGLMETHLSTVRRVDLGGSVVDLVLTGIAHHFADQADAEAHAECERMLAVEDRLLAEGEVASDHVLALYAA